MNLPTIKLPFRGKVSLLPPGATLPRGPKALKLMVRLPIISCSTVDPMILVGEIGFSGLFIDWLEVGLMETRNHNRTYM